MQKKTKVGVAVLKKRFWKVFSVYIRMRDKGVCFSCEKELKDYYDRHGNLLDGWKSGQAGHFITAASCGLALYFHEQNVHCQCHYCNINLSGNWVAYEKKIIEVYGQEVCDRLKWLKWNGKLILKPDDYIELISDYKEKVNILERKR